MAASLIVVMISLLELHATYLGRPTHSNSIVGLFFPHLLSVFVLCFCGTCVCVLCACGCDLKTHLKTNK